MLRLGAGAAAAALMISFALVLLLPTHALAADRCVVASWYGSESGSRTATGERFDSSGLTAAMPSRKHLGEIYIVHFGHKSVRVRINDVGPAAWTHRGIDLSRAAAEAIGLIERGVGTVCLERSG